MERFLPPSKTASSARLPLTHLLLAVVITAVWGTNFVVIRGALQSFPPLFFALLRFAFVFLPAALFIKRPRTAWRDLILYGTLTGGGQFGLLYVAMGGYISPGLASLVVQSQVFFTVAIAIVTTSEKLARHHAAAAALALCGLLIIGNKAGGEATPAGLAMTLLAGLSWAVANIIMRRGTGGNMLGYIVWSSPFSILPLALLSLTLEGPRAIAHALAIAGPGAWLAVLWQSSGNTLFGFAIWGWLLRQHPAATVTPVALLIPVFGLLSSALFLGEPLQSWKVVAAALILLGLAVNLLGGRLSRSPLASHSP